MTDQAPEPRTPAEIVQAINAQIESGRLRMGQLEGTCGVIARYCLTESGISLSSSDALLLVRAALTRPTPSERPMVPEIPFDPTNHHNALKCPYCNPDGLVLVPSERHVAQVREALERARDLLHRLLKGKKLGVEYAEANQICHEISAALTSERPSEAAVAWRCPYDTIDAGNNKHVCYLTVTTGELCVCKCREAAIPHGDAMRAQTIEECAKVAELDFALRFTNFDKRDAVRKALADVAKAIRALQPSKE